MRDAMEVKDSSEEKTEVKIEKGKVPVESREVWV